VKKSTSMAVVFAWYGVAILFGVAAAFLTAA
jgi:hypothetical protein